MNLEKRGGWTIFKKLLIFSIALVVLPVGIVGGFGLVYFTNTIEEQIKDDLANSVQGKVDILHQALNNAKKESKVLANTPSAMQLLIDLDEQTEVDVTVQLKEVEGFLADTLATSYGLYENLFYIDMQGIIVADAKQGEAHGIDVNDLDFFIDVKKDGGQALGDVMESPITGRPVVVLGTPVTNGQGQRVGYLGASIEFNKLTEMLVKRSEGVAYNYGLINRNGLTIAHEHEKYIFTLNFSEHEGGLSEVYQKASKGEAGIVIYTLDDEEKILAFEPFGEKGWTVYVAYPVEDYMIPIRKMTDFMLLIALACLAVAMTVGFFFSRSLAKPIQSISEVVGQVSEGDLTVQLEDIKLKDEIGQLNQYFKTMLFSLRGVISNVVTETEETNNSSIKARVAFQNLKEAVENISATVEEISAGLEESASATQEVAASSQTINSSIEDVAQKAQAGSNQANAMLERAKELRTNAMNSKANTEKILGENQAKLQQAVKDAEVVQEIEKLTSSILAITNQTNLLALNAAIEAARAGEAGQGFAVVADEIRQLAEESAVAASDIQNVTKQVTQSVANLIGSSNTLLEFIDREVADDYDMLANTGQQYDEDARMVATTMEEFSSTSERLAEMVGQVARAINEISGVISEGADGANTITSNIMTIVEKSDEVGQLAEDSGESAKRLEELVGQFKI